MQIAGQNTLFFVKRSTLIAREWTSQAYSYRRHQILHLIFNLFNFTKCEMFEERAVKVGKCYFLVSTYLFLIGHHKMVEIHL